ncbi:hypothetical protein SAMN04515671_0463 [Nakamurella panacisegetis]|uniref:Lipid droplet-associated protein n=1 Tax=Nakamurella panacisegetis TaxID=1090615 RepID=A0A1H0IDG1_9ACTN|nr:lipid droplet-associated protein [Nakamurella panacisegetis]SDO29454.1 hypothetical protein SAMN04515671_0463 [Nakamurella panacisegetis]
MAITLPFGVRVAVGVLGAAVDRLVTLPRELPAIGVSLAGQAVRTSLRVQQELAELATRGDELLSGITGRPEEHPAWATFDDEEEATPGPDAPTANPAAGSPASAPGPRKPRPARRPTATADPDQPPTPSPTPIRGDHLFSLAELKDRLQDMDITVVQELLVLERSGPGRAAYLTLLENRLTTLGQQNGQPQSS